MVVCVAPKERLQAVKSRQMFEINNINNCFIIRSTYLFSYSYWQLREAICHFSLQNVVSITHEQDIICSKTRLDGATHEQTIGTKEKLHQMINLIDFACR